MEGILQHRVRRAGVGCLAGLFALSLVACGADTGLEFPPDARVDVPLDVPLPPIDLTGRWSLSIEGAVAPGEPPRTYVGTLVLVDHAGALTGTVDDWSNGAHSDFTGTRSAANVRLDRTDRAPFAGFRAQLVGDVAPGAGTMRGTFQNDPTAGGGNGAAGPWSATRLP